MTTTAERRRYKNPPIEEALVEFHFAAGHEWDLTIPGKLHERVKAEYPTSRQQMMVPPIPGFALPPGIGRVQLVGPDATRLLSLGPNVLSVNVLRPYEGWELFRPRIERALRAYLEVSGAEKVSRIGLRYINRIAFTSEPVEITEYFEGGPPSPNGLPERVGGFVHRSEYGFDDGVKLVVTFASIPGPINSFLLDLDVIWESAEALDFDAAIVKVEELHDREKGAFEALIKDKTREALNA